MKKIDWVHHFIELVVVFIGITGAFLLNSWRENRAEKQLGLKYYNSLIKDLTFDADDFDEILTYAEYQDSVLAEFLSSVDQKKFTDKELTGVLQVIVSFSQFTPETGTFETIKYSGNLDVFSDYELREEINSYYSSADEVMLKQSLLYNYMINYCIPYMNRNVDILSGKLLPDATLGIEFSNLAVGYQTLLRQNLNAYRQLMEDNLDLKLKLARKLSD